MRKSDLVNLVPVISGLVLLAVTKFDLYQFNADSIDVRVMLSRELPIVLVGLISSIGVFLSSFYWLFKRRWFTATVAVLSPLLFLICFGLGGMWGAAYLYAT